MTYTCQRPQCGHTWTTRIDHKPVRCPRCSSTTWSKPRKEPSGKSKHIGQHGHDCQICVGVNTREAIEWTAHQLNIPFEQARIMRAAPDLLAALEEIERRSVGESTIALQEIAQRAIAQAKETK